MTTTNWKKKWRRRKMTTMMMRTMKRKRMRTRVMRMRRRRPAAPPLLLPVLNRQRVEEAREAALPVERMWQAAHPVARGQSVNNSERGRRGKCKRRRGSSSPLPLSALSFEQIDVYLIRCPFFLTLNPKWIKF
uniref:Uncharacterized protein n=2 Tax=Cacopsylla melanoneura TaxID=428564 RepID=A0A8D8V4A8_9HEMI